ncbi:MAG: hypothetical protein ABIK65_13040 [Candidatus Eisenbacteria bacterium]
MNERLSSPLVVRPINFADGSWRPAGLWFEGTYPDGEVVLFDGDNEVRGSAARFDVISAPGDTVGFSALTEPAVASALPGDRVRTAFFEWLKLREGEVNMTEVVL